MNWSQFLKNWERNHPVTEPDDRKIEKLMDALIFGGKPTKKVKK